jgi:hypothetical protein
LHVDRPLGDLSGDATSRGHLRATGDGFAFDPEITCVDDRHSVSMSFEFDRAQFRADFGPVISSSTSTSVVAGPRWGNLGPVRSDAFYRIPAFFGFVMQVTSVGEPQQNDRCEALVDDRQHSAGGLQRQP